MCFYISFWVSGLAVGVIVMLVNGSMMIVAYETYYGSPSTNRLAITQASFGILMFINMILLDLIILWHYWRAGNNKQNHIATKLAETNRRAREYLKNKEDP